jgi:thiamine biosynthesis lipoprotein
MIRTNPAAWIYGYVTMLLMAGSCAPLNNPGYYIALNGQTQGTTYHIIYESKDSTDYQSEIDSLLREFDLSLSTYEPGSIISRINRDEQDVELSDYFIQCFNASRQVFEASGGAFDITVAPVVNAWGFGFTEKMDPDSLMIDSLLQYVGMDKIGIENGKIRKEKPGVMLDVNAIAQGYAVDIVSCYLASKDIHNYLVEIGGEVRTIGINPHGQIWTVGIDKPIEGLQIPGIQMQAVIRLKNRSLATSGNYRRFYIRNGVKYSHTIDPVTGYPVQHNLLSATVLADECMIADGFATAFMVLGIEKSKLLLEERKDLDAYLIYTDEEGQYTVYYTTGIKKLLLKGAY